MKTLLILRHAKSTWKHEDLTDYARPLNKRGKKDAPNMGKLLHQEDLIPDFILSSSAKRARETARLVANACDYNADITLTRDLYQAEADDYIKVLRALDNKHERVLVIGHNPGMEMLLCDLTEEYLPFPTAALAQISLPIDQWHDLGLDTKGELINLWVPRQLRNWA